MALFLEDSIGDSTRSLLSPLGGELIRQDSREQETCSENSINSALDESVGSKASVRSSELESYLKKNTPNSESTPKAQSSKSRRTSSRISTSCSTRSNSYYSDFSSESKSSKKEVYEKALSPWEEWLVRKTAEQREKQMRIREKRRKEKEEFEKQRKLKEDKQKEIEEKINEWIDKKNKEILKSKTSSQKLQEQKQAEKEEQNRTIEEKSKIAFDKWMSEKLKRDSKKKEEEERKAREEKDKLIEKKMKSEQAYEEWLKKAKSRPKSIPDNYCYAGGVLTAYYNWGSYPTPNYCNPMPWVQSAPKRNRAHRHAKRELQPPSPPLLFKEQEQRSRESIGKGRS
ncbi:predicted protein [Nematostella vectensis]|uniref:Coiled-coil domain-containing protein n=1 Tax=Nematostella vectensis TaxID=45351 RepID=A7RF40_NEMVE|nr:coiled-coil domain-containing protein 34 [Nematostella vectensis]EDO49893.1 predicted protein [Nematostella vectensis]|eukprot:XP_001641956.1 predicted protein [Nematostella vectensis]